MVYISLSCPYPPLSDGLGPRGGDWVDGRRKFEQFYVKHGKSNDPHEGRTRGDPWHQVIAAH